MASSVPGSAHKPAAAAAREQLIRGLFEQYIEMYAARDERLISLFSDNFSGCTGGGTVMIKDRAQWAAITRQDFAQVPGRLRIEMLDLSLQDLSADVVLVTAFFHIHLPVPDEILSRETARLVLAFRLEQDAWKIVHSSISVPYHLVREGEVYPLQGLLEHNRALEALVAERTCALAAVNNQLEILSNTDGLTGIANRRHFDARLEQEWKRAQRSNAPLSLVMADVDHFKHFNDCYGHLAGDACLRALAGALSRGARRAGDSVARFGGEEFVALLADTGHAEALNIANLIRNEVHVLAIAHEGSAPGVVTASFGVATMVPSPWQEMEELVRRADVALYEAKQAGRDCIRSAVE